MGVIDIPDAPLAKPPVAPNRNSGLVACAVVAFLMAVCSPLRADVISFPPVNPITGDPGIGPITVIPFVPGFDILILGTCVSVNCQLFGGGTDQDTDTSSVLTINSTLGSVITDLDGNVTQAAPLSFTVQTLRSPFTIELSGTIDFLTFDFVTGELKGTVKVDGGTGAEEYGRGGTGTIDIVSNGGGSIVPRDPEPSSVVLLFAPVLLMAIWYRSKLRAATKA